MLKEPHFTPKLFAFLRDLDRNNEKAWFERNKGRYLADVRDPMLRFIADLAPRLRRVSPRLLADPRPVGGSMFRIYRDVRFARDKRPYKTAATARFPVVAGKDVHVPGYYVHLGFDTVYMAGGIWHPDPATLAALRRAIVENPAKWKRSLSGKAFTGTGFRTGGDSLQRVPRGFDPDHPLAEDLKRKDHVAYVTLDEKAACKADFLERYVALCAASKPFVKFLAEAAGLRF